MEQLKSNIKIALITILLSLGTLQLANARMLTQAQALKVIQSVQGVK